MKNLKSLTILLFVAIFSIFSLSCTQEEMDDILGPENTWCRTAVDYSNDKGSTSLYVWCLYSNKEIIGDGSANGYRKGLTIPKGLTIVVTPENSSDSIISSLTSGKYILKSFPDGEKVTGLDGTETSWGFTGSKAKWTALYLSKSDLRKSENQKAKNQTLDLINSESNELSFENIKDEFSWKKLLLNNLEKLLDA